MAKVVQPQNRSWCTASMSSSGRCGPALAAMLISLFGAGVCHAGCPNDYPRLDTRAEQATDAFNGAAASSRCAKARELVRAEQMLSRFVEAYQVQCVLDPEIIEVQQRRLGKAKLARDQACRE